MTGALLPGKLSTVVVFISLIAMVMLPDMNEYIILAIAIIDSLFLTFAFVNYIIAFATNGTKHKVFIDKESE